MYPIISPKLRTGWKEQERTDSTQNEDDREIPSMKLEAHNEMSRRQDTFKLDKSKE
jgi:hypothetical protein